MLKTFIGYGLFPINFLAAMAVAYIAVQRGWEAGTMLAIIALSTVGILFIAERISPYYPSWNQSRGDVGTDLIHAAISQILLPKVIEIGIRALIVAVAVAFTTDTYTGFWPRDINLLLQLAMALLITEFGRYWWHRATHKIPLLWRFHAIHHSSERLYWLNAGRFHPVDTAIAVFISVGILMLLGAGPEVIFIMSIWIAVHGLYQHCNVNLRLGPLNYIFSMAELHRWHHSLSIEKANHNYGSNIILWDIVFGTFYWPKGQEPSEAVGISEPSGFPQGYIGQILAPFRWNNNKK